MLRAARPADLRSRGTYDTGDRKRGESMHVYTAAFVSGIIEKIKENPKQIAIYVGIGIGAGIALWIVLRVFIWLTRGLVLRGVARVLGFEYSMKDIWELPKKCAFLPLFSKSTGGRFSGVVHGSREGVEVRVFDYTSRRDSGVFRFRRRVTVVLMEMNYNFPFFYLRRERFSDKLAAIVGHNDIDDFSNRQFASKFYVKSADRQFAHDLLPEEMITFVMSMVGDEPINIEMTRSLMAFHLEKRLNTKKVKWLYNFGWEFYQKTPEEAVARAH